MKGAYRVPVLGHLLEADCLADVDQVENVLLEAGAAKAHAGVQELGADPRVCANAASHLQRASRVVTRERGLTAHQTPCRQPGTACRQQC